MSTETNNEGLKRVIGVSGLALAVVNFTIGAGIFTLPAIVGIQLGAFGIFGYLFCSLMLATIMLCYVEIGSRVISSGGSYAYVEAAFGPFAGFIVNWLIFFGWGILSDAAIMNIIADSLSILFPVFLNPLVKALLFFVLFGWMILVNIRGAKQGVYFVSIITITKLIPLLVIIVFGFSHIQPQNLHWEHLPSFKTFGDTTLVLFFVLPFQYFVTLHYSYCRFQ
jgi:amino acid transporter